MAGTVLGQWRLGRDRLGQHNGELVIQSGSHRPACRLGAWRLGLSRLGQSDLVLRTIQVEKKSFKVTMKLGDAISSAKFKVKCRFHERPLKGETIKIGFGSTGNAIFVGWCTKVKVKAISANWNEYDVEAESLALAIDRKTMFRSATVETSGSIVKQLIQQLPYNFFFANIQEGVRLTKYFVNFLSRLKVIEEIAEQNNFLFYITKAMFIHFHRPDQYAAPFDLTEANLLAKKFILEGIDADDSDYAGLIYVRYSDLFPVHDAFPGDGETTSWAFTSSIYEITSVYVNDVKKTWTFSGSDDEGTAEFIIQLDQGSIKNGAHAVIAEGDTLHVWYDAKRNKRLKVHHQTLRETYGMLEKTIEDRNIIGYDAALLQTALPVEELVEVEYSVVGTAFEVNQFQIGQYQYLSLPPYSQLPIVIREIVLSIGSPMQRSSGNPLFTIDITASTRKKSELSQLIAKAVNDEESSESLEEPEIELWID